MLVALAYIQRKGGLAKASSTQTFVALSMALLFSLLVAYSRLLLGVHSIDQVIFGGLLGTWLAFSIHFLVREPLKKHLEKVITRQD